MACPEVQMKTSRHLTKIAGVQFHVIASLRCYSLLALASQVRQEPSLWPPSNHENVRATKSGWSLNERCRDEHMYVRLGGEGCEQPGSFSIHASSYTSEYLMNQYAARIQSIDTCSYQSRCTAKPAIINSSKQDISTCILQLCSAGPNSQIPIPQENFSPVRPADRHVSHLSPFDWGNFTLNASETHSV